MEGTYRRVLSCSTLTGDWVRNKAGEDLGKIHDLMIDLDSGRIAYAVLGYGGVLGVGEKLFAIPWGLLKVSEEEHMFILDMPRERLESAPGFDKDNWPDMSDPEWSVNIHSYYGTTGRYQEDGGQADRTMTDRGECLDESRCYV